MLVWVVTQVPQKMNKHIRFTKAFQFYKVEAFITELIKNLSKVERSANKTLHRILKFYEGLKSGTTYKDKKGPTNTSKYIDNNIF